LHSVSGAPAWLSYMRNIECTFAAREVSCCGEHSLDSPAGRVRRFQSVDVFGRTSARRIRNQPSPHRRFAGFCFEGVDQLRRAIWNRVGTAWLSLGLDQLLRAIS
jgi:hypothetical protein